MKNILYSISHFTVLKESFLKLHLSICLKCKVRASYGYSIEAFLSPYVPRNFPINRAITNFSIFTFVLNKTLQRYELCTDKGAKMCFCFLSN